MKSFLGGSKITKKPKPKADLKKEGEGPEGDPKVRGSRKPKPKRDDDRGKEQESTAQSAKKAKKKDKKGAKTPNAPSPSANLSSQLSVPKKDKKDKTTCEDDPPTIVGTVPSTIGSVVGPPAPSKEPIGAQTPPGREVGSTRGKNKVAGAAATVPAGGSNASATSPAPADGLSTKNLAAAAAAAPPPPAAKEPEKWAGEGVAKTWMDKAEFPKVKEEFQKILTTPIHVDRDCKKWKAHMRLNRSDEHPVFDATLVKSEVEYVNMSRIETPLGRSVLVGQLPVAKSEESFWKVVFEKKATSIHILADDKDPITFFPQKAEEYANYGQMWVNNRRVEWVSEDVVRSKIEVLPHGLSNSIICNVTVLKNWNIDSVHAKHSVVIKETIELSNFLSAAAPEETALILSLHGAGRAGFFLALSIAVKKMDQKVEPNLSEIVRSIRSQRPRAVETLMQYASLYISLFYLIKRKAARQDGDKKAPANPSEPLCKKSMDLTTAFTNALIAEASQPSVMGVANPLVGAGKVSNLAGGSAVLNVTLTPLPPPPQPPGPPQQPPK